MSDQESVDKFIQNLREFVTFAKALREVFVQAIEPYRRAFEAIPPEERNRLSHVLSQFSIEQAIKDFEREEHEEEREICQTLLEREWWVRLDEYFTWEELKRIPQLAGDSSGTFDLDSYICSKFRENDFALIRETVERWWAVPYLLERKPIILNALSAHRGGAYALSVPALLPLMDGLASEIADAQPELKTLDKKPRRQPSMSFHLKRLAGLYHESEANDVKRTFGEWRESLWSDMFEKAIKDHVYKDYRHGSLPPPSILNRHAILHGWVANYASEANSLRCFLLLDVYAAIA